MDVDLRERGDGVDAAKRINEAAPFPVVYLLDPDDRPAFTRVKSGAPAGTLMKPAVPHRIWRGLVEIRPPV